MAGRGTPRQGIRIDPDLWADFGNAVKREAAAVDRPEVLRRFIRWYTHQPGAKQPKRPPKPTEPADPVIPGGVESVVVDDPEFTPEPSDHDNPHRYHPQWRGETPEES